MGAMKNQRPRFYTVSEMYATRIDLWLTSAEEPRVCYRSVKVDLIAMILARGDIIGPELRKNIYCSVCKSRRITTIMSATGRASAAAGVAVRSAQETGRRSCRRGGTHPCRRRRLYPGWHADAALR